MAASSATPFPVKGQTFHLKGVIVSSTTWNRITGGLSGLYGWVVKDDGDALVAMTTTPTEIGATGLLRINLSATEMGAYSTTIVVGSTNTGMVEFIREISNADLTEKVGMWDAQTPIRLENLMMDICGAGINRNDMTDNGTNTLYNRDGVVKGTGTYTNGESNASRGKIS